MQEFKNYIDKLCTLSNNYFMYNDEYIKSNYDLDSYDKFRKYYKKNHLNKLIFNSRNSEKLFIKLMNVDTEYISSKYGKNQCQIIFDFFIKREDSYFNTCEENKKHVEDNCKCKIKVNSVVNLPIKTLMFILNQNDVKKINVIKLHNNQQNNKIINCIKKLNNLGQDLGIDLDAEYVLTDTKYINNEEDILLYSNTRTNVIIKDEILPMLEQIKNTLHITPNSILLDDTQRVNILTILVEAQLKIKSQYGAEHDITKKYNEYYNYMIKSKNINNTDDMYTFNKYNSMINDIINDIKNIYSPQ